MALEIFRLVGSVFVDTDKADKSLQKTDKNAQSFGSSLVSVVKSAGKFATAVVGAATAAGTAIVALSESTREYRTEQGKLKTAFDVQNFSAKTARKTYSELNGVLGDSGQAVEAASHLAQLASNEKELAQWTDIATGVYATFGDSLPIEGLAEAANETAKTGALTGGLSDAINWAAKSGETFGVTLKKNTKANEEWNKAVMAATSAEDYFNLALQQCSTEQERAALITSTMNGLYSEASGKYKEMNADVIAANKAQDNLNQTMANVGSLVEPIITKGKELLATVLEKASPYIEELASVVIPWLVGAISGMVDWFDIAVGAIKDVVEWFQEIGGYAADTLQPILDDLSKAFEWVKQKIDPLISALAEYFTSGEATEDITNIVKDAIDFLAAAYEGLKGFIEALPGAFQAANEWMAEHETMLVLIAIAIGTLTAAIVAYNTAQAIKNAGGIAELVQLGLLQIQLWALTAAETAHTVATTIATAATTAWGAAVAFLTSPITLIIAAIGALIAIIYLLVTNWDTVKETAIKCWEWIKETWSKVADWFNTKVVQPVVSFFVDLGDTIGQAFSDAWQWCKNVWSSAGKFFSGIWDGIKGAFGAVGSWFKDTFSKAWQAVKNVFSAGGKVFDGIKDGISDVFKTVVNALIRGINKIISVPFTAINKMLDKIRKISILDIKPFSWISTFTVPKIPELEKGGVLERGQVGLLEGNGAEAVVPLDHNKRWVSAVAKDMDAALGGSGQAVELLQTLIDLQERTLQVMSAGQKIVLNERELGRTVRSLA